MKLKYIKESDSLFVIFSDNKSVDSFEIADGVIADVDSDGKLIGIEFYSAKDKIDFNNLLFEELPFNNINFRKEENLITV
ncbi:DUF2283 domain-containing protein [Bacteroidota bacterium]